MKEDKFPHTRRPLHWWRWGGGREGSFGATEESSATGLQRAKWRDSHTGSEPTSTHQPERVVCSPTAAGRGWELRLRLRRSDPRERTGVGCVNTARRGLVPHS